MALQERRTLRSSRLPLTLQVQVQCQGFSGQETEGCRTQSSVPSRTELSGAGMLPGSRGDAELQRGPTVTLGQHPPGCTAPASPQLQHLRPSLLPQRHRLLPAGLLAQGSFGQQPLQDTVSQIPPAPRELPWVGWLSPLSCQLSALPC